MKFVKLRLLGFKSFVEPTEFLIEDGLTGVVGPNGCGKSNLVEALRWVMGENSYKNMRASGMDDVIFSGSGNRPARNTAEVGLFLDNADRTAPAMFNDSDELQVTRRIEREAGSVYRINGREVRARDVQLLFADASTGARSPSMVGQGRIGELISAKPQARRALLEEAAGISGLHSRRHEAELRLRGAEQNLERLEDVLAQMESQVENLKRQSRQANRYRALSAEIRRAEALLLHLRWTAAKAAEAEAQSALSAAALEAGKRAEAQAQAAKDQAVIAAGLPGLREEEAKAAAALQRLRIARDQIDAEARRIDERRRELEGRIHQLDADMARERRMLADNAGTLERLASEEAELREQGEGAAARAATLGQAVEAAAAKVAASENAFAELTGRAAQEKARKQQIERTLREMADRARRVSELAARAARDLAELAARDHALAGLSQFRERVELLEKRADDCEADAISAERAAEAARQREQEARGPLSAAEAEAARIATEAKTLARILSQGGQGRFPGVVERLRVAPGYEAALGAALGEDLDAPADPAAPAHWLLVEAQDDAPLPQGVRPLAELVQGPAELARRLAQTGLCARGDGPALQRLLKPGQRLVSREGDLWRWDGFVSGAEAPSAAAQRLAQKNRLAELEAEAQSASAGVDNARAFFEAAKSATAAAIDAERKGREAWRAVQHDLAAAREELARAEREATQFAARKAQLEETRDRLAADLGEAHKAEQEARAQLDSMPDPVALESALERSRAVLTVERSQLAQARAEAEGLARETAARERRLAAIAQEIAAWRERAANAEKHVATLAERMETARAELRETEDAPGLLAEQRRALGREIDQADNWRAGAAGELAQAEAAQVEADRRARDTLADLSAAREERVRAEERAAAAAGRRAEAEARIREELECHPADALKLAERAPGSPLPGIELAERELERLRSDRERLGPVNLRAEVEQAEIQAQRDALIAERDDLVEAIKRLRAGIASLNREGRERLLEAFDVVNAQFQRLFATLFGGGTAELQLIESDDPLEAGLEILARPPGKKPQTMTLLSGGEQALTAMALIFAVFLTNPAPICVLDEVDAPLDDHNVERFCNLMDEMAATTSTRFLIITHNPITMARMNRLFGVTMAERGVSQLVSVDLQQAEKLREAG